MVLQKQAAEKDKKMGRPQVSPHPGGILGFYCRLIMPVCSTVNFFSDLRGLHILCHYLWWGIFEIYPAISNGISKVFVFSSAYYPAW